MSMKTTRKALARAYFCKTVGYCDLQNLFPHSEANAHTEGVYGWNFDAFTYGNKCITTGYRSMIGDRVSSEIVKKYEAEACKINRTVNDYTERKNKIRALQDRFFEEAF